MLSDTVMPRFYKMYSHGSGLISKTKSRKGKVAYRNHQIVPLLIRKLAS